MLRVLLRGVCLGVVAWGALGGGAAWVTPARAEGLEEEPVDPEVEQAERDYRAAVRATRAGNNALALSLFEKALPKKGDTSDIFYNLVQVAKLERQHDKVVLFGQGFLALEPDGEDATQVARLVTSSWNALTARGRGPVACTFTLPDGARVLVDGVPVARASGGRAAFELPPGSWALRVEKVDHVPHASTLVVTAGQPVSRDVALTRVVYRGKVKVLSNPADGVQVFLDDKPVGVTPLAAPLDVEAEKKLLFRFERSGYDPWLRYVELVRNETLELTPVLETSRPARR